MKDIKAEQKKNQMIKKKYVTRIYVKEAYCDKCGAPMRPTGYVFDTYPARYPYACSNPNCDGIITFFADERPGQLLYEFEQEETDV